MYTCVTITFTQLQATQGFTDLCKAKDGSAIENILTFWPRIYHKLAHVSNERGHFALFIIT